MMETRRLLWLTALIFSVILLAQYFELPYGYLLSSLLSFGNSQVHSESGLGATRPSSPFPSGNNLQTSNDASAINASLSNLSVGHDRPASENNGTNIPLVTSPRVSLPPLTSPSHLTSPRASLPPSTSPSHLSSPQVSLPPLNSLFHLTPPQVSLPPLTLPSHLTSPEHTGANRSNLASSPETPVALKGKDATNVVTTSGKPGLLENNISASVNDSSISSSPVTKRYFKGPPALVVPISVMNDMLHQSRVSYKYVRSRWASLADVQLLDAKSLIEKAQIKKKPSSIDVNLYRNFSAFTRSYELMEQTLKVYIYTEGKKPIFHQPELYGIYASEGWFMKQLNENKHFVTKNADEAHLFYLPFSSRLLQETLYVPNSHSRKNMVQYLSNYLQTIKTVHRFWNRTDGSDHFLAACHDWAPAETSRIMKNCIRALCNADVKGGFQFGKDVSLPETYVRYPTNPLKGLGGKPPSQRRILAFFAGKMHGYLRPVLLKYWENKDPDMKIFPKLKAEKGRMTYVQYMKSSKYCISAKGYEAYTPRVVEAIFYECVPVIISDNYIPPFFETLNWESFAIFILEKDIPNLKKILLSVPEERYLEMQRRVRQVQKHFLWHDKPEKYDVFHMILHSVWYTRVFQIRPG